MVETLSGPAYRIHTRRLILRCWEPRDASLLVEAVNANLDHLRPWMPWAEQPVDLASEIALVRRFRGEFDLDQDYVYGVLDPGETRVLGGSGLHKRIGPGGLEIGYWIDREHLRQGLASEVAGALTRVAFEVQHVQRVEIHCDARNIASAGVARKLGFAHSETRLGQLPDQGREETMIWILDEEHYPHSPAARGGIAAYDCTGRRVL